MNFIDIIINFVWFIIGLLAGYILTKIQTRLKYKKLPKGSTSFMAEIKYITKISELKIGDGKPTYRGNTLNIADPEVVPEGIKYFLVGVYDGKGFGGGKDHKIWIKSKNYKKLIKLHKKLSRKYNKQITSHQNNVV